MIQLPTLSQLISNVLNDLETEYGVNISLTRKVALRVIAAVQGGQLWLLYKVVGFTQKQVWPDTANTEAQGGTLEQFGRVRLNRNPFPAVQGQYTVTVTGSIGATLPAQTTIAKSNDNALSPGFLFVLDNAYTLVSVSDSVTLRALTAGTAAKLAIGDTLTFTSPIPNVDAISTVSVEVVQPLAAEAIEAYRAAILASFQLEAQGGAATDYRIWSDDAQGVERVYPYAKSGETNAVNLFVEATIADSTDGKGTPSQAILDDVESVVNFNPDTSLPVNERGRRPLTVIVYFLPVTPYDVNITITGGAFSTSEKAAILSAMQTQVNAVRPYVAAADPISTKNNVIDTNKLNGVIYSAVPGAVYTGVSFTVNGSPVSTYTFLQGFIPYLNTLSYV